MGERRLLHFAHRGMALIDRGCDPRAVAMLGFDRLGQAGIGGAQL